MAEPKPVSEKPNLVAVAAEPQAEARPESAAKPPAGAAAPQAPAGAATSQTPKAAPAAGKAAPVGGAARPRKGTRWGMWLLVLLVAVVGLTAWVQTRRLAVAEGRVTALSEQVLGLQSQLSAANTQIHTYEMQRGQVREAVSDIAQRVLMLNELVGGASPAAATPEAGVNRAAAGPEAGANPAAATPETGTGSEAGSAP